jgi:hypothetical protein
MRGAVMRLGDRGSCTEMRAESVLVASLFSWDGGMGYKMAALVRLLLLSPNLYDLVVDLVSLLGSV